MVVDDKRKLLLITSRLDEEKEELKEIVDFLKQPRKFVELGQNLRVL